MRFIKPCSRLRGIRFGCQVRFIGPFFLFHFGFLVDYSGYPYNLSIAEAEGRVIRVILRFLEAQEYTAKLDFIVVMQRRRRLGDELLPVEKREIGAILIF